MRKALFVLIYILIAIICFSGCVNPLAKTDKDEEEVVTYTVVFDSDGGEEIQSQVVEKGGKAIEPIGFSMMKVIKNGIVENDYEFDGWYLNETVYDFDSVVNGDITLKAHWKIRGKSIPMEL